MLMTNKLKTIAFVSICFFAIVCLSACSTRRGPINDLTYLAEKVKNDSPRFTEEDWASVNRDLDAIEKSIELYKSEYTAEEHQEIGRLKGIILAQRTKYSIKSVKSKIKKAVNEAEGLVEGFLNGLSSEQPE